MADIHVLECSIVDENKAAYQYALHLPTSATTQVKQKAILDPDVSGFESQVPTISQVELDQIRAADLVEEIYTIEYNKKDSPLSYLERIQTQYATRIAVVADEYERRYQWYANEYPAT
jgi:hypothetical protein